MSGIHHVVSPAAIVALAGVIFGSAATRAAEPQTLYSVSIAVGGAGANVEAVIFDGHSVWVSVEELNGGYVRRLDSSGAIQSSTAVGIAPLEMAYDGSRIWVTDYTSSDVTVIAADGMVLKTIQLPADADPEGILFDGEWIWVANNGEGSTVSNTVSKFNPATLTLTANYPVGDNPDDVAFDGTDVWVTNSNSNNLFRLNRQTGAILNSYAAGLFPLSILYDGQNLWIGNGDDANFNNIVVTGTVTKIRANGALRLGTFPVGSAVRGLAFDGTLIWVCNSVDGTFTRLQASDGARMGTYQAGAGPRAMAFDGTRMWIADSNSNTVTVVAPLSSLLPAAAHNSRTGGRPHPGLSARDIRRVGTPLTPLQTTVDIDFSNYAVKSPQIPAAMAGLIGILLGDN